MMRALTLTVWLLAAALAGGPLLPVHAAERSPARHTVFVTVGKTGLGTILVTARHLTLYYWEQERPGVIKCTGHCAQSWPPLIVPRGMIVARTARGIKGVFGSVKRPDGRRQVTFRGRALYRYVGDHKPGDTTCQAIENWYVVKSSGELTGPSR